MILLLGGTSETAGTAEALADAGYRVLVSTATDMPLAMGCRPGISRRCGKLDSVQMRDLITSECVRAIVDVGHPYAVALHDNAAAAAQMAGVPYIRLDRPGSVEDSSAVVRDHDAAARMAFAHGRPVLLTTGSRHLAPYTQESRRTGIPLIARVLDHPESSQACQTAGLTSEQIVVGRGPFSVEDNRALIRRHCIGVLVTKDSGRAGGVDEKIEAARQEHCHVVVVGRASGAPSGPASLDALVDELDAVHAPVPVLALDLESVLVPEIWHLVAQKLGVLELALTTRDVADYAVLMQRRIALCRQHGITVPHIRQVVATIEPLDGAAEFLSAARRHADVVVITGTYPELAGPLLARLGVPAFFCNSLDTDAESFIVGWTAGEGGKRRVVEHLHARGRRVIAVGDSFNDVPMLDAADAGFLFRPTPHMDGQGLSYPVVQDYDELFAACCGDNPGFPHSDTHPHRKNQ